MVGAFPLGYQKSKTHAFFTPPAVLFPLPSPLPEGEGAGSLPLGEVERGFYLCMNRCSPLRHCRHLSRSMWDSKTREKRPYGIRHISSAR